MEDIDRAAGTGLKLLGLWRDGPDFNLVEVGVV